jgi:hypothetical protein
MRQSTLLESSTRWSVTRIQGFSGDWRMQQEAHRSFLVASTMGDVLQKIADDIRHSYTLGYVSANSARDGKFRRIRVVVNDPDRRSLGVRARDGYRAGEPLHGR